MTEDVISSESSTETESSAETSQATTQPAQQQTDPNQNVPFHQHPRFREITTQNRQLKDQLAQLQRAQMDMQRAIAQSRSQGGMTDEQRRQYGEAAAALKQVMQQDPELAQVFDLLKQFPQFAQTTQGISQLQRAAAKAQETQARSHIADLVEQSGVSVDKEDLGDVAALVARRAMALEQGNERYTAGDLSVLDEAFAQVLPLLKKLSKPATVATAQTKAKVKTLPAANVRGGLPGDAAVPKLEKGGDTRKYESSLGDLARKLLGTGGA